MTDGKCEQYGVDQVECECQPQENVSVPPSLPELPPPPDLLPVQGEVLGNPLNGVGVSSVLRGSELAVESTGIGTVSQPSRSPRVGPPELLVVVDAFAELLRVVRSQSAETVRVFRGPEQGDVEPPQTDVQANVGFDLVRCVRSVLSPRVEGVRIPAVSEVAN